MAKTGRPVNQQPITGAAPQSAENPSPTGS